MTQTRDLSEFFREKKERADAENAGIDWPQRKDEWLAALGALYEQIRSLLTPPLQQGLVQLVTRSKTIAEAHLGQYEAPELLLTVGDERVVFSPRGRNVVGAVGRVDVVGESGEAMLVLQPDRRWAVVKTRYPQLHVVPLNDETLGETLRGVMRQ